MIEQDKQLLLKDLCARLPYGVILANGAKVRSIDVLTKIVSGVGTDKKIEDTKYYLRPMSSMTEEEREEWADLFMKPICELEQYADEKEAQDMAPILYGKSHSVSIDWLNKHHFDYRGLIPMGLALEAPEGIYNIKEK